jgi:hypothetical protein
MVRVQVARDPQFLVRDLEVLPKEADEKSQDLGVRIREACDVLALLSFGPIQHAAGGVKRIASPRERATLFLGDAATVPRKGTHGLVSTTLCRVPPVTPPQRLVLVKSQFDVGHPPTHRRWGQRRPPERSP